MVANDQLWSMRAASAWRAANMLNRNDAEIAKAFALECEARAACLSAREPGQRCAECDLRSRGSC